MTHTVVCEVTLVIKWSIMAATVNTPGRPAPPKPVSKPGKVILVRALQSYTAQHSDELSFEEGDLLYIQDSIQSNTNSCRKVKATCGNRSGWIPANAVEEQVAEVTLPLHDAARRGNTTFLKECLSSGMSGTTLDSAGCTPLYWAALSGHEECFKLLLDLPNPPVNAQNKMGDTPLHAAASHGHLNIVNLLLEAGCDTTLKNNSDSTAEDVAESPVIKNAIQMVKYNLSNAHDYNEDDYNDESD